jgi:branched-subunit amino acid ABC-type transport system permease component
VAIVLTVFVFAPLLGAFIEVIVMRGLQGTSETTKLVVPVAVLLALNGAATWVWFRDSSRPYSVVPFFGEQYHITIFDQPVSYHQIIGVFLAVVIAGGLWAFLFRTRTGITMRATVDDPALLTLNGGKPTSASVASWAIGSMLGGLAGVLLAPQLGALQVFPLTLLVVDAYPAAMFGRLRSVPRAFIGALGLGLIVEYWDWISEAGTRWPSLSHLRIALPALLLFVVLLVLPQDRLRGAVILRTRERFKVPTIAQAVTWGVILVVAVSMLQALMADTAIIDLGNAMGLALMALSLVLLTGYAGELNLAVFSFAGIALIVAWQFDVGPSGLATRTSMSLIGILLAMAVCAVVGGLTALPALRLRGLYLGLATFALAIIVSQMVILQGEPVDISLFGKTIEVNLFTQGSLTVPRPKWFGVDLVVSQRNFVVFMAILFAVLGTGLIALRRSTYGRLITAMKDSPAACATLGLNIRRLKLSIFMLSAALAGLGGLMWSAQIRQVSNQDTFDVFNSLALFMLVVVGGIGYVSGALIAGLFLAVLSVIMPNVLDKLGTDYASLHWLFVGVIGNFVKYVGPAMVGIGLGRNPTGIAENIMVGFRPLRKAPEGVAALVLIELGLWAAAFTEHIGNWTFAIATIAVVAAGPSVIKVVFASRFVDPSATEDPDMVGIDRPFTGADRDRYDAGLGITQPVLGS